MTLDPQGRIVVLDEQDKSVTRWSAAGAALGRFGRGGGGPLEFVAPTGVVVQQDGTVIVLDRALGLRRFTWDSTPHYRDTWLRGDSFDDLCTAPGGLVGARYQDDGTIAQLIDATGTRTRGVGRAYQSPNAMAVRSLSRGTIGCLPNGTVAGATSVLPYIWIWDPNGATIATTRLEAFHPISVKEIQGGLQFGMPEGGYDEFRRMVPVGPGHFLVQLAFHDLQGSRDHAELTEVRSYLLSDRTGKGVFVGTSLPLIAAVNGATAVGWRNDPVPEIVILR